ncbi:hypothetical protein [Pseudohongiella sp. O18]|uniref:hypothetical protein n=1 Tax=Pseudohongiella sp. O18 TaxID=2904248 RepID=UPI001F223702|nr:hypothetical protein [Pseudohongiella sp. O18]
MRALLLLLITFSVLSGSTFGQDNTELEQLYLSDQSARQAQPINWEELREEDAVRREQVLSILRNGDIQSARDYFHAAMIFQHGNSPEDIRLAHSFATIAATLDSSLANVNWLKAATWDRLLLNFDQPQWFGTQFVRDGDGSLTLYKMEPDVISDEQRTAWSVPTVSESLQLLEQRNNRN